jgi:YVTN family beta-propeller protein
MKSGNAIPVGSRPVALAAAQDGTRLYVADQGANAVSVIDVRAGREVARIPASAAPSALALASDGTLFVADTFANDVTLIDTRSNTVTAHIPVGVFPRAIALAGGKAFVANWAESTVSVIDTASRKVVRTLHTGEQPAALAASPDGSRIYVAVSGDNAFQTIDVRSGNVSALVYTPGSSSRTFRTR